MIAAIAIADYDRQLSLPTSLQESTGIPLYTSLDGVTPSATPFNKISRLPWASSDLSGSEWRNTTDGDRLIVGDRVPPTMFFEFQDGLRTDDWVRVDVLPLERQLDWACFRLNWLEGRLVKLRQDLKVARRPKNLERSIEAYLTDQRTVLAQWTDPAIAFYQSRQGNWRWRNVPTLQEGDRVQVLWVEPGLEDDLDRIGTVGKPERYREQRIRVWFDGDALGRLLLPAQLELVRQDRHAIKLNRLQVELDSLIARREALVKSGEVRPGCWIEKFPTKKPTNTICKNVDGGYAFWCWMQNGKVKRKSITPADLGQAEAIEERTQQLKKLNQEIDKLQRQLDRAVAVCAGSALNYIPDSEGKQAGQWDLLDTRDNYPAGQFPHARFAFVVFQWRSNARGGLSRGKAHKKFHVPIDAATDKIETVRLKAIELVRQLGSGDNAKLDPN